MGMANIHSIRKSFQSLRFLCTQMPDPAKYVFFFTYSFFFKPPAAPLYFSSHNSANLQSKTVTIAPNFSVVSGGNVKSQLCSGLGQTSVPDLESLAQPQVEDLFPSAHTESVQFNVVQSSDPKTEVHFKEFCLLWILAQTLFININVYVHVHVSDAPVLQTITTTQCLEHDPYKRSLFHMK